MRKVYLIFFCSLISFWVQAQDYTFKTLLQESITITSRPNVTDIKEIADKRNVSPYEKHDTTYAFYTGGSIAFSVFTIHGEEYSSLLNPEPVGVIINGKRFGFFCSTEQSLIINPSGFLDIYEFKYLSRKYLCFLSLREDCLTKGCRYKCYNFYDITDPQNIIAYSFSSIYSGSESFGDFNFDGKIDFIRVVPRAPESFLEDEEDKNLKSNALVTAFTIVNNEAKDLEKELGNPYYIYITPKNEEITSFTVLGNDWFMPMRNVKGEVIPNKLFYPSYTPFDPKNQFLHNTDGHRVDMKAWVIHLTDYDEIDGAQDFCLMLREKGYKEAFIKIDQYDRKIWFRVFYGNYWSKDKLMTVLQEMRKDTEIIPKGEIKKIINPNAKL
ncbi:MAG: hypothetical protein EAZ57_01750 [Cytophagales bacterium]|nr:MAG: hypothetical protein EAZ67_02840 [Cytophagales bacterium]TAF61848.1 MAG: hypothetical protein EAZ57_01750 [Cytophagales bacterium]